MMFKKSEENDSISDCRIRIRARKRRYAMTAGIVAARPVAVAISALGDSWGYGGEVGRSHASDVVKGFHDAPDRPKQPG